ncbi:hypothetical protein [Roseomonas elaeocarpi]|uniref:General stress protein 17M-like domain-containing protein n=1 Tax=Roseomonas elaeocarpi TaxID=907779 RepID=A0ABV6JTW5_9PROT
MTRTVSALFDRREDVDLVIEHLVQQDGVDRRNIEVHAADDTTTTGQTAEHTGIWASLKALFSSDTERHHYSEGIRRGGIVLTAELEEHEADHAETVFREHNAVDLDSRREEWRSSGWEEPAGGDPFASAQMQALAAASAGSPDPIAVTGAPLGYPDADGTAALDPITGTRVPLVTDEEDERRR